jgi:predicted hotdog family 3-hydroxylacyl-ACP dehydratase
MQAVSYNIEDLLYHARPMILIDRVEAYDTETIQTVVEIDVSSPFLEDGQVPAYVGIEYMAQSIAAYSGIKALQAGGVVKIGYLASARNMTLQTVGFKIGEKLEIEAKLVYDEAPMAVFDCQINTNDKMVAAARLNVYQP